VEPNRLSLVGLGLDISSARLVGLVGGLLALLAAGAVWLLLRTARDGDETTRIAARLGPWLVDAAPQERAAAVVHDLTSTANDLKPPECAGVNVTAVVVGNDGTGANELVLGDATGALVRGRGGNDCVLGGGGNDDVRGNAGTDVCIGGPGTDTFNTCETQFP
jgi:Ca2+-binding RTX toxin-like protein